MEHLNLPSGIKVGIDLVFMPRMEKHLDDTAWLSRILTHAELEVYEKLSHQRKRLEFLSGRFAAKEAYSKAMGTGIGPVDFKDYEVLNDASGAPKNVFSEVSISHDGDYATAVVILHG